jgi:hypothetical protein
LPIVRAERRSETPGAGQATPVMETQTSAGWQRAFTEFWLEAPARRMIWRDH